MNRSKILPRLKETPTTKPELLKEYRRLYEELAKTYPKSRALQITGQRCGGVSPQTVRYHLFPDYRDNQKKQPSKTWSYEKQDPIIRKRVTDYKARYMAARYHIDDLIRMSYQKAEPQKTITIEDLSYEVQRISGILFKPSTLLGLSELFKSQRGYPLLEEVGGDHVSRYRLFKK
jgi:hypothetical protein